MNETESRAGPRQRDPKQSGDSVSRSDALSQPAADAGPAELGRDAAGREPPAHVVLYQPEIPQNTGNIGRTCVATGAKLWIVRPAAFRLDEKRLRRAGLDYWQHLDVADVARWEDLEAALAGQPFYFFSRHATRPLWDASFCRGDVLVFGNESSGLPESILDPDDPRALRLPTSPRVRSLNLATTVGVVLYEHLRQTCDAP